MKNVDIVCGTYINLPNGLSKFLYTIKQNLGLFSEQGYNLKVYTKDCIDEINFNSGELKKREKLKRCFLKIARYSHFLTYLMIKRTILKHSKEIAFFYYKNVSFKGELVLFQDIFSCYYYLRFEKEKRQMICLTMHNKGDMWQMIASSYPLLLSPLFRKFRNKVERLVLENSDRIGFVSKASQVNFICTYPQFNSENTYCVYNGIGCIGNPSTHHVKKRVSLICVATLNDRKNQIGILQALDKLPVSVQKQIKLIFVGDGPSRFQLEKKAKSIFAEVVFTGSTNNVRQYLEQADCFILFAKEEGLPISIIEAMSVGLPIIGSNIDGIPEQIIDGKTGFLVDVNPDSLSKVLNTLLKRKDDLPKMGMESYKLYLENFTVNKMVDGYVKLFDESFKKNYKSSSHNVYL